MVSVFVANQGVCFDPAPLSWDQARGREIPTAAALLNGSDLSHMRMQENSMYHINIYCHEYRLNAWLAMQACNLHSEGTIVLVHMIWIYKNIQKICKNLTLLSSAVVIYLGCHKIFFQCTSCREKLSWSGLWWIQRWWSIPRTLDTRQKHSLDRTLVHYTHTHTHI